MAAMWTMMNSRAVIDSARRTEAMRGSLSSAFAFASSVSACWPRFSAESPIAGFLASSAERRRVAAEALRTFSVVRRNAFMAWSPEVLKRVPAADAAEARSRRASVAVRGMEPPVEGACPAYHKNLAANGAVMARLRPHAQDHPAPLPGAVVRRARAGRSGLPVPAEPHPDPLLGPGAADLDPRHSGRKRGAVPAGAAAQAGDAPLLLRPEDGAGARADHPRAGAGRSAGRALARGSRAARAHARHLARVHQLRPVRGREQGAGDALGPRVPRPRLGRSRAPGGRAGRERRAGLRSAPLARRQERRIR